VRKQSWPEGLVCITAHLSSCSPFTCLAGHYLSTSPSAVDTPRVHHLTTRPTCCCRPGIDTVNLVIFVGSEMAVEGGRGVLARVLDSLGFRPSVELRLDVIVS
jgi:hypothetical protein